jgi:putative restriction endonuclease
MPDPRPVILTVLQRRAAEEAGFDLEPEIDGAWWRLRASGARGIVWVAPLDDEIALLALPLEEQLEALRVEGANVVVDPPALPTGAAGFVACRGPHDLYRLLRRTWLGRQSEAAARLARWQQELQAALATSLTNTDAHAGASEAALDVPSSPLVTEAIAQIRRRIGQDLYREAQLALWGGRCAVTGLAVPELLRASHAKPWKDSADAERVDPYNGLLLAVHLDALFDQGFLAFDDEGRGMLSVALLTESRTQVGLTGDASLALRHVLPGHRPYLAWHREQVFRG